jgi:hypothetical protein
MHALHVGAEEEIGLEIRVGGAGAEALQMRLATGREFRLAGLDAAIGAGEGQHGVVSAKMGCAQAGRAHKKRAGAGWHPPAFGE